MKRHGFGRMFRLAVLLLAAMSFGAQAADAQRFAVVNLEQVFREYRKSRIAEDAIKQQAEIYRGYMVKQGGLLARLKKEAEELRNKVANPALAQEERTRLGAEVVLHAKEVAARESELQLYVSERAKTMREIEQKKRDEIMVDIRKEIDRRATAEGFDFVLDSSGKTMNEQPTVLRFPASCDLTETVIRELNRAMTEVKKPEEKKKSAEPAK